MEPFSSETARHIRQMNQVNSRNDLSHDDSSIYTIPSCIIITVLLLLLLLLLFLSGSTSRVDGPSTRPVNSASAWKRAPVNTARVDG